MKKGLIISFLLISYLCSGQSNQKRPSYLRLSFGLNVGLSFIHEKLPENISYNPVLILGYYNVPLTKTEHNYAFSWYLEPQFNPVLLGKKLRDMEFGMNTGIAFSYRLGDNYHAYAAIGVGPHFITVKTASQSRGFIFSDNFILGLKRNFFMQDKSYDLNIQYRFRHISNANIMQPNKGIDNHFLIFGLNRHLD